MPFTVEPLAETDMLEWTMVHYRAFQPMLPFFWDSEPSEEGFKIIAEKRKPGFQKPESHTFKCVDSTNGKIAGVAHWKVYEKHRTPEEVEESLREPKDSPDGNAQTHINLVVRRAFMSNIWGSRRDVLGGQPAVVLGVLTVAPEYQRQGIGKMLMKWGVEEADRLGIIAYVEGSKVGKGLYEQFGYKPVKELYFDTRPFGGDYTDVHTVMIRQPVIQEKSAE